MRRVGKDVLISRGALVALLVSWVVLVGAVVWIVVLQVRLSDQQDRDQALAREICRSEKLQRSVLLGMALNEPNLDSHLVLILTQTLAQLPEQCNP